MVKFNSGVWIIILTCYFICLSIFALAVNNSLYDAGQPSAIDPQALQYQTYSSNTTSSGFWGSTGSTEAEKIYKSISWMTGFGSTVTFDGFSYWFIFNIFIFWIPGLVLIWALYTAIPFI